VLRGHYGFLVALLLATGLGSVAVRIGLSYWLLVPICFFLGLGSAWWDDRRRRKAKLKRWESIWVDPWVDRL
jgi:hypothetical protein